MVLSPKPFDERKDPSLGAQAVIPRLGAKPRQIQGGTVVAPPPIVGLGTGGGFTYVLQDLRGGDPKALAQVEGAWQRFRPVMMTSFAFILGLLPLVLAVDASQLARRHVGTPVFGVMIFASLIGIFVIPPLYVAFQTFRERIRPSARAHKAADPDDVHPTA